ncbi:MAG: NAD-dependent protein deacylase, partial [Magnetospirillum sp.]|nr:NAD-dependent protein deacylase [Magnetospirillum sp.]
ERAGSVQVIHMHGELLKVRCRGCGQIQPWTGDVDEDTPCPLCHLSGHLRPHVVWFGEMPLEMDRIGDALDDCALFISIGTSGHVYPAAGFVSAVRQRGLAHTVELNLDPSEGASLFNEAQYGPASELVPAFVNQLLGG